MVLEGESGNATLVEESYRKLARAFADFEGIVVYPGFFGYRKDGTVATFPRGGSDITGSILATAVRADVYENFTDVDNVYPVDPRIVPEVKDGIATMTYREMRELAYAGFGVFNDEAIAPAVQGRIPINVRNTNRPAEPGTMIQQSRRVTPGTVTGIAAADGFSNIIIDKYLMNREIGFTRKVLAILEEEGVAYEHIPSGIDSISVLMRGEKFTSAKEKKVVARIKRELAPDSVIVTHDYAVVMVVGEGMAFSSGMLAKATGALAEHGINISMVNQGASEISFMIGIKGEDRDKAVRALYAAFFEKYGKGDDMKKKQDKVTAVIELRITPAKDTGFAKIAQRIARFPQVDACFLMSGAYDLLVFVSGASLQDVAHFVSAELSTIDGVLSTATHFMLKTYKAKGLLAEFAGDQRLPIV